MYFAIFSKSSSFTTVEWLNKANKINKKFFFHEFSHQILVAISSFFASTLATAQGECMIFSVIDYLEKIAVRNLIYFFAHIPFLFLTWKKITCNNTYVCFYLRKRENMPWPAYFSDEFSLASFIIIIQIFEESRTQLNKYFLPSQNCYRISVISIIIINIIIVRLRRSGI